MAAKKAAKKKAAKKKAPKKEPGIRYIKWIPGEFTTTTDYWEVDDSRYVILLDRQGRHLARVVRFDTEKTLAIVRLRKQRIPIAGWLHLMHRAGYALDPFRDGTPIEKAKRIPRELKPYINEYVRWREQKKENVRLKAERAAAREAKRKAKEQEEAKA
jgi:hypothetical protein